KELECELIDLKIEKNKINLIVSCPPRLAPSYMANYFKGKSARIILKKFPELREVMGGKLWSRDYLVATIGEVTDNIISEFVNSQMKKSKIVEDKEKED
ncbi:IS200/IS605 family transposase, partial [Acidianus sp. RZ1]